MWQLIQKLNGYISHDVSPGYSIYRKHSPVYWSSVNMADIGLIWTSSSQAYAKDDTQALQLYFTWYIIMIVYVKTAITRRWFRRLSYERSDDLKWRVRTKDVPSELASVTA